MTGRIARHGALLAETISDTGDQRATANEVRNSIKIKSNPNILGKGRSTIASAGWRDFEGRPMTEEEEKMPAGVTEELDKAARLLDPHLSDATDFKSPRSTERWPVLKALVFIFGASLLIWALVIALIYDLL